MGYNYNYYYYHSSISDQPKVGIKALSNHQSYYSFVQMRPSAQIQAETECPCMQAKYRVRGRAEENSRGGSENACGNSRTCDHLGFLVLLCEKISTNPILMSRPQSKVLGIEPP